MNTLSRIDKEEKIKADYLSSLYRKGLIYKYINNKTQEVFSARIIGIDDIGQLIMEIEGKEEKFGFKDISYIL